MGLNKTTIFFLLVVVACTMVISAEAVRVPPCDQVCSRINREKDECCRAHGHSYHTSCNGGMHCN